MSKKYNKDKVVNLYKNKYKELEDNFGKKPISESLLEKYANKFSESYKYIDIVIKTFDEIAFKPYTVASLSYKNIEDTYIKNLRNNQEINKESDNQSRKYCKDSLCDGYGFVTLIDDLGYELQWRCKCNLGQNIKSNIIGIFSDDLLRNYKLNEDRVYNHSEPF